MPHLYLSKHTLGRNLFVSPVPLLLLLLLLSLLLCNSAAASILSYFFGCTGGNERESEHASGRDRANECNCYLDRLHTIMPLCARMCVSVCLCAVKSLPDLMAIAAASKQRLTKAYTQRTTNK